jgi:NAD(P)-dependent dehydrogenase (short-subunit alcohol dehydrogenase family)
VAGRVIVVTGASAGVGRAVAREFGARGDTVALLARGEVGLDGAVKDVEAAGGRALALPTDVADDGQVAAAAIRAEEELGPIDVWVNVAFAGVFAPFTEIRPDEFKRVTEVTYLGYVYGTRAALERMLPRDRGVVVQVGSALAYRGIPLQTAYCGAKHAIQGFTEALRCELLHDHSNVRLTMVQLPAVNTPQFDWVLSRLPRPPQPVPPIYQPEAAARAVVYAAEHPRRREYWVGGTTAGTLVANSLAPGLLDRYLSRTGFKSQQGDRPANPDRPVNLWAPVDGPGGRDFGARGSFDSRTTDRSVQLWLSQHHGLLAAVGGAVAGLAALGLRRRA